MLAIHITGRRPIGFVKIAGAVPVMSHDRTSAV